MSFRPLSRPAQSDVDRGSWNTIAPSCRNGTVVVENSTASVTAQSIAKKKKKQSNQQHPLLCLLFAAQLNIDGLVDLPLQNRDIVTSDI